MNRYGIWGVFARADHPNGYGWSNPEGGGGPAHGYVVLFVGCKDSDELDHVAKRLAREPFTGLATSQYNNGFLGDWYGGRFDLIASTTGAPLVEGFPLSRFRSFGDNRFVGTFDADEILAPALPPMDSRKDENG